MLRHRSLMSPLRLYLSYRAAHAFFFGLFVAVSMLYQIIIVGLSPVQLLLVGAVLEGTIFLMEIPTGVVADVYSRRLSVVIGTVGTGIGFLVMGAAPTFGAVLLGNFIWGLSETFLSGALSAWFVDEAGQAVAETGFLRGSQAGQVAGLLGTVIGAGIGSFAIVLPLWLAGGGMALLGLFLVAVMPEAGFAPVPRKERETWRDLFGT